MKNFQEAVQHRRSIYGLSASVIVPEEKIEEIMKHAILHTPTPFNNQSSHIVLLFHAQHEKFWDIVMSTLRSVVPADKFAPTEAKVNGFKSGYGTALFFEDTSIVAELQQKFPLYKDNFKIWSYEALGMLQSNVWVGLEEAGLGASLQHYNPLVNEEVRKTWNLPEHFELRAQMPFGAITEGPGEKEFVPVEKRIHIYR